MVKKSFWSKVASIYPLFVKKDKKAYDIMLKLINPVVKNKCVLELATGNGIIAKNILNSAKMVEATDYSKEMIEEAKKGNHSIKLHFSVQDIFNLPYCDKSFEVIIASNVLHIIQSPEIAIAEMKRVLTDDGILILPTFVHGKMNIKANLKSNVMRLFGFPLYNKWTENDYLKFLKLNGLVIIKNKTLKSTFPLTYVECKKQ